MLTAWVWHNYEMCVLPSAVICYLVVCSMPELCLSYRFYCQYRLGYRPFISKLQIGIWYRRLNSDVVETLGEMVNSCKTVQIMWICEYKKRYPTWFRKRGRFMKRFLSKCIVCDVSFRWIHCLYVTLNQL